MRSNISIILVGLFCLLGTGCETPPPFNLHDFEKLKLGMTKAQVEEILRSTGLKVSKRTVESGYFLGGKVPVECDEWRQWGALDGQQRGVIGFKKDKAEHISAHFGTTFGFRNDKAEHISAHFGM